MIIMRSTGKGCYLSNPGFIRWYGAVVLMLTQSYVYSMGLTSFEEPGMEAALLLQRYETGFDVGDSIVESRINRAGLVLFEPAYSAFQPGLQMGAFNLNQSDNPVTAGISLSGNYLGVLFRSLLYSHRSLRLQLEGGYTYHDADKVASNQEVSLQWHEYMVNLHAQWAYGNFYYAIGGYSQLIEGEEVAYGAITQTREFKVHERTGVHFGVEYSVDATGKVGFQVDSGGRQGVGLIFSRGF